MKVNDENSSIRIRKHLSKGWIRGSGSVPTKMSWIRNTGLYGLCLRIQTPSPAPPDAVHVAVPAVGGVPASLSYQGSVVL